MLVPQLGNDVVDGIVNDWDLVLDQLDVRHSQKPHGFPGRIGVIVPENAETFAKEEKE